MNKTISRVLFALLALLVIIQFFGIDKENPPLEMEKDLLYVHKPPAEIGNKIRAACYDCHSHETTYPWYTSIAPVSWWIKDHINEGREELNFSTWSDYEPGRAAHKMEEAAEEVEEGHMPLPSYLWIHGEARLSEGEKESLATWFKEIQREIEAEMPQETGSLR